MKTKLHIAKLLKIRVIVIVILLCFFHSLITMGQVNPAHYFSETTPLNSHYNPALTCQADFFLGLPFLTSFNLDARNSFKYNDYIVRENDSLWASPAKLVNSMDDINYSSVILNYDILYLGFRKGSNYFRFGLRNKFSSLSSYSNKTAALALTGNAQFIGKTTSFQDNYSLTNMYQEYYLSYTRTFAGKFSFGVTAKFLTGIFNVWAEDADFELAIDETNYNHLAKADFNIHTSSPLPNFKKFSDRIKQLSWVQFSDNTGYAFDLGVSYTFNKNFQFSASVIDIGKIRWDTDVKNFVSTSDEAVPFEGMDLGNIFEGNKFTGVSATDQLTELSESFGLEETSTAYTAPLSSQALVAGSYSFLEKNKFGVLVCSEQFIQQWHNSYAVNFSRTLGKWLKASVYYSFGKYMADSFGVAIEIQSDELLIIIATNSLYGILNSHDTRRYNLQVGLGWQINKKD